MCDILLELTTYEYDINFCIRVADRFLFKSIFGPIHYAGINGLEILEHAPLSNPDYYCTIERVGVRP